MSQLPVVDLGEDFDIEAILERPPPAKIPKLDDVSCATIDSEKDNDAAKGNEGNGNITKYQYTLEDWSRGQVPGLKVNFV